MNYDEQEKAIAQQRARFLQQQNQQAPEGRMVGGRYVAANPLEYLAAGLRGYGGFKGEQQANQELTDLQGKKQQAMQGDMSAMLSALRGTPEKTISAPSPFDTEGAGQFTMPAQAGSMDKFYETAAASQFPQFQQMGMQGAISSAQQQAQAAQKAQEQQKMMSILQSMGPQEAVAAGVPLEMVKNYHESRNYGRDEVSQQIEIEGPNGEKLIQNIDKFGQPVGAPTPAYTAPVQVNSGGAVQFVKPTAGKAIPVTMSPSEKDASARGWAGVRNASERLAFDKTKPATGASAGMPTEGERKAATLLQRMQGSEAQLEEALKKDKTAEKPGLISSGLRAGGMETLANTVTPENRQKVEAAQLDILDAALTLGTGAAYTKEQLEGYRKSYFPQLGDKPETIKDKQTRLNNILDAARIAAGRAGGQVSAPPTPSQTAPKRIKFDAQGNIIP